MQVHRTLVKNVVDASVSATLKVLAGGTKYRRPVGNRSQVWLTGLAVLLALSAQGAHALTHYAARAQILKQGWGDRQTPNTSWYNPGTTEYYVLRADGNFCVYKHRNAITGKPKEAPTNLHHVTHIKVKGDILMFKANHSDVEIKFVNRKTAEDWEFELRACQGQLEYAAIDNRLLNGRGERYVGFLQGDWFNSGYAEEYYVLSQKHGVAILRAYPSHAEYSAGSEPSKLWKVHNVLPQAAGAPGVLKVEVSKLPSAEQDVLTHVDGESVEIDLRFAFKKQDPKDQNPSAATWRKALDPDSLYQNKIRNFVKKGYETQRRLRDARRRLLDSEPRKNALSTRG